MFVLEAQLGKSSAFGIAKTTMSQWLEVGDEDIKVKPMAKKKPSKKKKEAAEEAPKEEDGGYPLSKVFKSL